MPLLFRLAAYGGLSLRGSGLFQILAPSDLWGKCYA